MAIDACMILRFTAVPALAKPKATKSNYNSTHTMVNITAAGVTTIQTSSSPALEPMCQIMGRLVWYPGYSEIREYTRSRHQIKTNVRRWHPNCLKPSFRTFSEGPIHVVLRTRLWFKDLELRTFKSLQRQGCLGLSSSCARGLRRFSVKDLSTSPGT